MPPPPDAALAHYSDRQSLVTASAEVAGQMWSNVDPARIVESWTMQVPELTAVLSGAQLGAARQADPYLDEVAAWQELDPETASPIDPRAFAGTASDGRSLASLLMSPAFSALQAIASGLGTLQSLSLGRQHLDTIARTQVADAGRLADGVSLAAHKSLSGYVRVVVGKTCSRCMVLAGKHYAWNAGFQRHPHCDCIHLPSSVAKAGKLVQNPKHLYDSMTTRERQRAGWSLADQKAIADGADLAQVTNAHRGVYTAGGRKYTTQGTTKRGFAGARLKGARRLTPEQIYAEAADRDATLRLLYDHGYLVQEPAVVSRRSLDLAAAPPTPTGPAKRAAARARQAEIARRSEVGDLLAELDSLIAKKADLAVYVQRLDLAASTQAADAATLAQLRRAVETGDTTKLRAAITRVGKKEALTPIGRAGQKAKFDEVLHEALGDLPPTGASVTIVRRGTVLELNGEQIQLSRAQTVLAEAPKRAPVKKAVPAKKAAATASGDLSKLTIPKLRELAKERGVTIPGRALKADIVAALDGAKVPAKAAKAAVKKVPAKKVATKPEDLTVAELRALAQQHGIPLSPGLTKPDIIGRIRLWEGGRTPILPGTAELRAAKVAARVAKDKALADDWKRWDTGRHVDIRPGNLPPIDPANPLAAYGNRLTVEDRGETAHTHLTELETIPLQAHGRLQRHFAQRPKSGFYVGDVAVPELDELSHLRGVQPRGWKPGRTWDEVPGAYSGSERRCALGGGPGAMHGCTSLALHEAGHALDHAMEDWAGRASGGTPFQYVAQDVLAAVPVAKINPYYTPAGNPTGYHQEMWAESFAAWVVHRGKPDVATLMGRTIAPRATAAEATTVGRLLVDYFERLDRHGWPA